jgi:hypothetical protein
MDNNFLDDDSSEEIIDEADDFEGSYSFHSSLYCYF